MPRTLRPGNLTRGNIHLKCETGKQRLSRRIAFSVRQLRTVVHVKQVHRILYFDERTGTRQLGGALEELAFCQLRHAFLTRRRHSLSPWVVFD
jgi:hypothetical protein